MYLYVYIVARWQRRDNRCEIVYLRPLISRGPRVRYTNVFLVEVIYGPTIVTGRGASPIANSPQVETYVSLHQVKAITQRKRELLLNKN